jgi:hypothetical protein
LLRSQHRPKFEFHFVSVFRAVKGKSDPTVFPESSVDFQYQRVLSNDFFRLDRFVNRIFWKGDDHAISFEAYKSFVDRPASPFVVSMIPDPYSPLTVRQSNLIRAGPH